MLTGWQIREARRLLNWRCDGLVTRAKLPFSVVDRAEASDGEVRITLEQEAALRRAFVAVGIEFGVGDDGSSTVRLRRGPGVVILTGRQIRERRALAGMTEGELAAAADVALGLVVRAEARDSVPLLKIRDAKAISAALVAAGVVFAMDGPHLRKDPAGCTDPTSTSDRHRGRGATSSKRAAPTTCRRPAPYSMPCRRTPGNRDRTHIEHEPPCGAVSPRYVRPHGRSTRHPARAAGRVI